VVSGDAVDGVVALCWGAWTELGVSGWSRTHRSWVVDPEPLLVLTAAMGDRDPRLRDEALDWCLSGHRYVSRVRLRSVVRLSRDLWPAGADRWGEFAATVNAAAGTAWPAATSPLDGFRATGRSRLPALTEPSLAALRMKGIFGLATRTEVLRHLLVHDPRRASAAELSSATGYTKRIVAEECDGLVRAGVLSVTTSGNRFYYDLARREDISAFVGRFAALTPDWTALARLSLAVTELDRLAATTPPRVLTVEAGRVLHAIGDDLRTLGLPGPGEPGPGFGEAARAWALDVMTEIGAGRWPV
jgi:hypothetical protein